MKNKFYSDFDFERLRESRREEDYRTPFQIDRDRVIHSSEFRRLQGKTQVFLPGEYDFYRTRLTHSIEVSQIGRSICYFLNKKEEDHFGDDYFIDPDLVESACLIHDLGHPPFGHAGERTLHDLMTVYGGFEGNAQTLRLITEIFYKRGPGREGMNPTRATVDSILKYKSPYSKMNDPLNHFIYDYQREYVDFVFGGRNAFEYYKPGKEINKFRSIECQIMDWADDVAYCVNDLVDSITGGFITIARLSKWCSDHDSELSVIQKDFVEELIDWIKQGVYKPKFGSQIGDFIQACSIEKISSFVDDLTNRYRYRLNIEEEIFAKAEFYKRISNELVFQSPPIHQMEFKGKYMIGRIFNGLVDNYVNNLKGFKLLPDFTDNIISREIDPNAKVRIICDYISGMTDAYALRTYRRLYNPDFTALADLV